MRSNLLFIICLVFYSCSESSKEIMENHQNEKPKTIENFFDFKKPKILVVGSFHFAYPNLDAYKIKELDKIDVLSTERQREIRELVDYIKKFNPTKIGVESLGIPDFTKDLKIYNQGNLNLSRDERHQLGVRIASEMSLDTIFSIDATPMLNDLDKIDEDYVNALWEDYDWKNDSKTDSLKREWYKYEDQLKKEMSLLNYFKRLNSPEYHQHDYGMYLIDDFKLNNYQGADNLSTYWYNRNLRIFRKIQDITENENDRILVIVGNSHAALLRQFITCSPEYEYIEFCDLETNTK